MNLSCGEEYGKLHLNCGHCEMFIVETHLQRQNRDDPTRTQANPREHLQSTGPIHRGQLADVVFKMSKRRGQGVDGHEDA